MYQQILLAADGSENSMRAANEALKIAKVSPNCIVTILFVIDIEKVKTEEDTNIKFLERINNILKNRELAQ